MEDREDKQQAIALARYQVISAYLAMEPARGQRGLMLEHLAAKTWIGPHGEPFQVSAETIRSWVRRYRQGGLEALRNKARPKRGHRAMTEAQVEFACRLKREVPERTLDRIIIIMEAMGVAESGQVCRSTLHRRLREEGLGGRALRIPDRQDLDRFQAEFPNDIWQSDLLTGPWLPDPERPGKMRRAYLYAFLDDHSRLLLHGRFSFKGDLPALELVFRRSMQRFGVARRVYYDNAQTYRAKHMRQIVAELGIHRIIFTQRYRPMGHGKIEALNRFIRRNFLAELKASSIRTLDELNEAFLAWADLEYNRRIHGETNQRPIDRWHAGLEKVRWADEEQLRKAFLWKETRKTDKTAVFSLFGTRYQTGAELANRRIEVRYDPERLEQVEVYKDGRFVERVQPFEVRAHRRPKKPVRTGSAIENQKEPTADWLGYLVERRRQKGFIEPSPHELATKAAERRRNADQAVVDLLANTLQEAVFDEPAVREHLERFGPYDADRARQALERLFEQGGPRDQHITVYLDAIRRNCEGEPS